MKDEQAVGKIVIEKTDKVTGKPIEGVVFEVRDKDGKVLDIGNIKAQMTDFERVADEAEQTEEVIPADPDVRNYTYTFFEGKLYYRENSEMVRKEVSQTAEGRIRSLDEIRQITRELIDIQMDGCSEEELSDKQRLLNVKYDAFVKQYGAITSKANRIAFRDDSDYPLLCSLEEVNEDGEVKKADMFYKQTIKAKTVIDRVETAVEGQKRAAISKDLQQ